MAYADQQEMGKGRIIAIAIVLLLHAGIGYALVTGLAYEAINKVKERLEVVDVQEEEPPEEEPPPPPPEDIIEPPPQVVTPPPPFTPPSANQLDNQSDDLDQDNSSTSSDFTCWDGQQVANPAQCREKPPEFKCWDGTIVQQASQCPPKPVDKSRKATPKNNANRWVTTNDYPSRSLQREEEGVSRMSLTISPKGRVSACTASGATPALNKAACRATTRRARFNPAWDKNGNPTTGRFSKSVRWQIPK